MYEQTLYDRLGERDGIRAVVDGFYDRLLDEQDLDGAVFGRNPHRDPALPAFRPTPPAEADDTDEPDFS